MRVELFQVPGCDECLRAVGPLKDAASTAAVTVSWRDINVLDELDRAVELGVLTLPAIAINDELVFTKLPSSEAFVRELLRRAEVRP